MNSDLDDFDGGVQTRINGKSFSFRASSRKSLLAPRLMVGKCEIPQMEAGKAAHTPSKHIPSKKWMKKHQAKSSSQSRV